MSDDCLHVSVSAPSRAVADRLARTAVDERLAACAQVSGPVHSTYRWQGRVEAAEEWLCHLKTTGTRYPALERRLKALHPYDNPEILAFAVTAGRPAFLQWLRDETTPAD